MVIGVRSWPVPAMPPAILMGGQQIAQRTCVLGHQEAPIRRRVHGDPQSGMGMVRIFKVSRTRNLPAPGKTRYRVIPLPATASLRSRVWSMRLRTAT
jgi:hypothetical protein